MPEIGEIQIGSKFRSYKDGSKYIWHACVDCGKERWVRLKGGRTRCNSCAAKKRDFKGDKHPGWKGGRITHRGYVFIKLTPDDFFFPMAPKIRYVPEHRLVMAKSLNRCLLPWEVVHHKGTKYPLGSIENRSDNRRENLELLGSDGRHNKMLDKWCRKLQKENAQLRQELSILKIAREERKG